MEIENGYAIIMAGGKGERFWPLSTSRHPKQVLTLIGGSSLLSQAIERLDGLIPPERILVITSAELVDVTREAAPQLPAANVVGEPVGRDTAAACALAAGLIKARCANAVFCVVTADHVMGDLDVFRATLESGMRLARAERVLITIGITPTFPSTGFGYIESGDAIDVEGDVAFRRARRFVEKPDAEVAAGYLADGGYYWNSGMFIWAVDTLQEALAKHEPPLAELIEVMAAAGKENRVATAMAEAYAGLERISIDYALMEKADNIVMAVGTFAWADVGAWNALEDHFEHDADGNVVIGQCEQLDASGNIVVSRDHLTALIGVQDLVIVQAEGATLICPKERAQDVKQIVTRLRDRDAYQHLI